MMEAQVLAPLVCLGCIHILRMWVSSVEQILSLLNSCTPALVISSLVTWQRACSPASHPSYHRQR
jgi:hypothetical protein